MSFSNTLSYYLLIVMVAGHDFKKTFPVRSQCNLILHFT